VLGFERAFIAIELAGAIQKCLALVHGATRAEPLPAWAMVNVARRVISKVATREGAIVPLRFVEHGNMRHWLVEEKGIATRTRYASLGWRPTLGDFGAHRGWAGV
jgi:hypothetical protein